MGTPVGAALIDAHAGALGTLGGRDSRGQDVDPTRRMALIMGTSACCIAIDRKRRFASVEIAGCWVKHVAYA